MFVGPLGSTSSPAEKAKALHYASVSVPLDIPPHPGECRRTEVPFGPPVIHVDPEKPNLQKKLLSVVNSTYFPSLDEQQKHREQYYFRIDGPCIELVRRKKK